MHPSQFGQTPLLAVASSKLDPGTIRILLRYGADPDSADPSGLSVLE